jgi:hypothetical protein
MGSVSSFRIASLRRAGSSRRRSCPHAATGSPAQPAALLQTDVPSHLPGRDGASPASDRDLPTDHEGPEPDPDEIENAMVCAGDYFQEALRSVTKLFRDEYGDDLRRVIGKDITLPEPFVPNAWPETMKHFLDDEFDSDEPRASLANLSEELVHTIGMDAIQSASVIIACIEQRFGHATPDEREQLFLTAFAELPLIDTLNDGWMPAVVSHVTLAAQAIGLIGL